MGKQDYLERCDKLAIMGGTFDPIHLGHLAVAHAVLQQFEPRRVLFIPSGTPPHKNTLQQPAHHRYQMVLSVICSYPGFDVSRMELDRGGESYTIDTIKTLRGICPKDAEIFFVTGADALLDILEWKDARELLTLCKFITVPRPGYDRGKLAAHIELLKKDYNAQVHLMDLPLLEISGTDIRRRFANDESVSGFVPPIVEDYAQQHGLYGTVVPDLGQRHFQWAMARLKQRLSAKRFVHTMGVVEESEKLAKHYGEDVDKARWAALLHDCTKEYSRDKKRALCFQWNIPLDPVLEAEIDITHSLLGAESALRDFYVTDPQILQAIRYHTTCNKGMTMLDKIIALADYIEPYRKDYPPLKKMRKHAYKNMDKALAIGIRDTIDAENKKGNPIHPWSSDALQDFTTGE